MALGIEPSVRSLLSHLLPPPRHRSEMAAMHGEERDVLQLAQTWLAEGRRVALATVVRTWGSSPRPAGSHLVVRDDSYFEGSVSGGCVEGAVVETALEVMADGSPRLLEFGVTNETA